MLTTILVPNGWPEHIQDAENYMRQAKASYTGADCSTCHIPYGSNNCTDTSHYPTCSFSVHENRLLDNIIPMIRKFYE
ncbi:hypothetical protein [Biomaibacter acetigenes]|uniref:hypothetical protein n=1 Tax=Biomaibacter acetigenes TaxID=2316383 RepID=UPI0013CE8AEE|nr:hypothetical protein [Biomaibacter acetigenes]